jgi:hypothetical protein
MSGGKKSGSGKNPNVVELLGRRKIDLDLSSIQADDELHARQRTRIEQVDGLKRVFPSGVVAGSGKRLTLKLDDLVDDQGDIEGWTIPPAMRGADRLEIDAFVARLQTSEGSGNRVRIQPPPYKSFFGDCRCPFVFLRLETLYAFLNIKKSSARQYPSTKDLRIDAVERKIADVIDEIVERIDLLKDYRDVIAALKGGRPVPTFRIFPNSNDIDFDEKVRLMNETHELDAAILRLADFPVDAPGFWGRHPIQNFHDSFHGNMEPAKFIFARWLCNAWYALTGRKPAANSPVLHELLNDASATMFGADGAPWERTAERAVRWNKIVEAIIERLLSDNHEWRCFLQYDDGLRGWDQVERFLANFRT